MGTLVIIQDLLCRHRKVNIESTCSTDECESSTQGQSIMSWARGVAVCLPRCWCSCFEPYQKLSQRRRDSDESIELDDEFEHEPPRRRPLNEFFRADELSRFGPLARQVLVVFDKSLPPSLHGKSVVEEGVPLAYVNPRAADHRYVILHELMHHQLDELGCPSLWVTVRGTIPEASWLTRHSFAVFARGALVQLWELIQHSRFNLMLLRVFNCSPESAREAEYRRYIERGYFQSFGLSGAREHRTIEGAVHVATVLMEGSASLQKEVLEFVHRNYANAEQVVWIGKTISEAIGEVDIELLQMSSRELGSMFRSMLSDLKEVLTCLGVGMGIWVGELHPLPQKFKDRCWTSVEVALCYPEAYMPPAPEIIYDGMPPAPVDRAPQQESSMAAAVAPARPIEPLEELAPVEGVTGRLNEGLIDQVLASNKQLPVGHYVMY